MYECCLGPNQLVNDDDDNIEQSFMWQLQQWNAMQYTLKGSTPAHQQFFKWKQSTCGSYLCQCKKPTNFISFINTLFFPRFNRNRRCPIQPEETMCTLPRQDGQGETRVLQNRQTERKQIRLCATIIESTYKMKIQQSLSGNSLCSFCILMMLAPTSWRLINHRGCCLAKMLINFKLRNFLETHIDQCPFLRLIKTFIQFDSFIDIIKIYEFQLDFGKWIDVASMRSGWSPPPTTNDLPAD